MSKQLYYILVSPLRGLPAREGSTAGVYYCPGAPKYWPSKYCYSRVEEPGGILVVFSSNKEAREFITSTREIAHMQLCVAGRYLETEEFERLYSLHALVRLAV